MPGSCHAEVKVQERLTCQGHAEVMVQERLICQGHAEVKVQERLICQGHAEVKVQERLTCQGHAETKRSHTCGEKGCLCYASGSVPCRESVCVQVCVCISTQ